MSDRIRAYWRHIFPTFRLSAVKQTHHLILSRKRIHTVFACKMRWNMLFLPLISSNVYIKMTRGHCYQNTLHTHHTQSVYIYIYVNKLTTTTTSKKRVGRWTKHSDKDTLDRNESSEQCRDKRKAAATGIKN